MKKLLFILLMCITLSACGQQEKIEVTNEPNNEQQDLFSYLVKYEYDKDSLDNQYEEIEDSSILDQLENSEQSNMSDLDTIIIEDSDKSIYDNQYTNIDASSVQYSEFSQSTIDYLINNTWIRDFTLATLKQLCKDNNIDVKSVYGSDIDNATTDANYYLCIFETDKYIIKILVSNALTDAYTSIVEK